MSDLVNDVPDKHTRTDLYENAGHRYTGPGRITGGNRLSRRFELTWVAGQRGKPGLNADINSATEAIREPADPWFEILGTNATSALSTYNADGGITLTTAGADLDSTIVLPHLATNQSVWKQCNWPTDQQTRWECEIRTGASIAAAVIWAGLKLTNTPTLTIDNDQVYVNYDNTISAGQWVVVSSIANVDTSTATGITVAAATTYHVVIEIDALKQASVFIDGTLVFRTAAMTTVNLIPYIGVKASGAAGAKSIKVYGETISRVSA